jgi:protein-disulfide isomerase
MQSLSRRHLLVVAGSLAALGAGPAAAQPAPGDMNLGNPNAKVKVVEYASLSCPHCAQFHADVFPAFKAKYIDTGRVYFTLREFLTDPPAVAAAGFLMARCAGPAKYFDVVGDVFRSQERWESTPVRTVFVEIANKHGLTEAQFETCLRDAPAQQALNERMRKAVEVDKINSTPSFLINGKTTGHIHTFAELEAAIAAAAK